MAVAIIADSTCDLSRQTQKDRGISVLPLTVRFGSEEYLDDVTITRKEFYAKLRVCSELPKTSLVTPEAFLTAFQKALSAAEELVCVTLSAGLSGTYQSAMVAREMTGTPERVFVIDSRSVTFGTALLVLEAVRMRDEGLSGAQIAAALEEEKTRLHWSSMAGTLKYLRMGGRLSSVSAAIGTVLHLKPLIHVGDDGMLCSYGVARGKKKAYSTIAEEVRRFGVDPDAPFVMGDIDAPELLQDCKNMLSSQGIDISKAICIDLGCVVGTHGGPGSLGVAWLEPKQA